MMDDVIYRQEAIDALTTECSWTFYDEHGQLTPNGEEILGTLKKMPSAQQWTPCSEIMPTKTGHYLCSFKKPNRIDRIHVDLAYWTGSRWYGYMGDEIKAWMPLPEPFEEDANETD